MREEEFTYSITDEIEIRVTIEVEDHVTEEEAIALAGQKLFDAGIVWVEK